MLWNRRGGNSRNCEVIVVVAFAASRFAEPASVSATNAEEGYTIRVGFENGSR